MDVLSPRLHQQGGSRRFAAGSRRRYCAHITPNSGDSHAGTVVTCALNCLNQAAGRKPVVLNKLSDSQAAYLAGIIDGEGTITLTRTHRGENRRPVVSISSTELPLLEYVRLVVGAGKITNKRRTRTYHSPSFAYSLFSRQALTLLAGSQATCARTNASVPASSSTSMSSSLPGTGVTQSSSAGRVRTSSAASLLCPSAPRRRSTRRCACDSFVGDI